MFCERDCCQEAVGCLETVGTTTTMPSERNSLACGGVVRVSVGGVMYVSFGGVVQVLGVSAESIQCAFAVRRSRHDRILRSTAGSTAGAFCIICARSASSTSRLGGDGFAPLAPASAPAPAPAPAFSLRLALRMVCDMATGEKVQLCSSHISNTLATNQQQISNTLATH
jgi:hypothetical protein